MKEEKRNNKPNHTSTIREREKSLLCEFEREEREGGVSV